MSIRRQEKAYKITAVELSSPVPFPPFNINLGANVEGLRIAIGLLASSVLQNPDGFGVGHITFTIVGEDSGPAGIAAISFSNSGGLFLSVPG